VFSCGMYVRMMGVSLVIVTRSRFASTSTSAYSFSFFVLYYTMSTFYNPSVIVYCVIANIDIIPDINAVNFFHLLSESSNSSGITSVAPT